MPAGAYRPHHGKGRAVVRVGARTVVRSMAICTVVAIASYIGVFAQSRSAVDQLRLWGMGLTLPKDMVLEARSKVETGSLLAERMIGRAGGHVLRVRRIEGLNATQADEFLARWKAQIDSVYDVKPSPYFAVVTTGIVCPAEFQPVYKEMHIPQGWRAGVTLYTNDRLTLGACTKELAKYRGELILLYCRAAAMLFEVEYFTPIDHTTSHDKGIIESATCL
jgi:hypothetical protein